jgi:hypothetical protein
VSGASRPTTRICVHGQAWSPAEVPGNRAYTLAASDCYFGVARLFAGDDLPSGYIEPDGRNLVVNSYVGLFAAIGNQRGNTNFQVPQIDDPKAGLHWGLCAKGSSPPQWDPPGGKNPAPLGGGG